MTEQFPMQADRREEVIRKLTEIFRDVLDYPELVLTDDLTADKVDGWDSLSHIDLLVAIERAFKIKFATREVTSLKNVGALIDLVMAKTEGGH
jgi:acyl carrier protein